MKIASIQLDIFDIPLTVPYRVAYGLISETRQYLITLTLENGVEGYGVGTAEEHVTGEADHALEKALESKNIDWLTSMKIENIIEISNILLKKLPKNPGARCAVDIALHDAYGKWLNKPLVDIFGRHHHALPTSVTVGICSNEKTQEQIEKYLENGFSEIKVKTGNSLEEDIDRIRLIYRHFGKKIGIRIDPNMGYKLKELKSFLNATSDIPIQVIEQPLTPEEMHACNFLSQTDIDKLMVDESLTSMKDAEKILSLPNHFGLMNIKLQKCGGLFPAQKIATMASAKKKSLMWGCFDESVIGISAALHCAYANPDTLYLDLDGSFDLKWDFASGGFMVIDGVMDLLDKPGLGVERIK